MMTREEVTEIMTYCQEHTVSTKTGWPNLESLHGGSMMQNPDLLNNKHKPNLAVESSCNWFLVGHLFQSQLLHQQPAAGYRGNIQSDGYEAYEQFERMEGITMYGCWAHARCKFVDALQEDEKMAAEAILYIRKLYKVEEDADNAVLSPDERKEQRLKICKRQIREEVERELQEQFHIPVKIRKAVPEESE